jgi:hypothetical protein
VNVVADRLEIAIAAAVHEQSFVTPGEEVTKEFVTPVEA